MKIISVHVVAFGKLKNVNLPFNSGLNVFQEANSFGKTTMASFIRAMLYGLAPARSRDVNNVSHFAPWGSNDRFGGSMVVEHNGETIRIERFFGATARNETLSITNEKTGGVISWQKQPGEMLLGLTSDSYDRSAYFPQEAVELMSNENLDSRLANLVENAEEYDKVQEKLRAYKKNLRYERGLGGRIYELESTKRELEAQLVNAQNAEKRAVEIDKRLNDIVREKAVLTQRYSEYSEKLTNLQRKAAQSQPTDNDVRVKSRLAELNEKLSRVPAEFDSDIKRCDALAKEIAEIHEQPQSQPQQQRHTNLVVKILSGIFSVVGIVLIVLGLMGVMSMPLGLAIGCGFAAAGCTIIGVVTYKENKRKYSNPSADKTHISSKKDDLIAQYLSIAFKYVYTDGVDYETVKRNLWQAHVNYQGDVRERDTLLPLVSNSHLDTSEVDQAIQNVNNVLNELTKQLNELATETGQLAEARKNLVFNSVEIMDRILTVEEDRKDALHRYEVADRVVALLEKAKENLSSSYLPKLCARSSELVQEITQNEYSVVIDRNFTVRLRENGQTQSMSEFSRGIREITLLCFRIALSELLYNGAIPFIIIDDAFVNFDEANFTRATMLLKKLSAHAQVVYFTCHNRTGELLK